VYAVNIGIYFSPDILFWGIILDIDKYIFLWQTRFTWWVILHLAEYGIL
jgi:hypothetical protein